MTMATGDPARLKPAVVLSLAGDVPQQVVSAILLGLEEEGIPAEVHSGHEGPAEHLARKAAFASMLHVGIGVEEKASKLALHHRDLGERGPLLLLPLDPGDDESLRNLGANAARLVKGDRLLLRDKRDRLRASTGAGCRAPADQSEKELLEIICRVVVELLMKELEASHGETQSRPH
jgi:hypothetical protein